MSNAYGVVYCESVPQRRTLNHHYCVVTLRHLQERETRNSGRGDWFLFKTTLVWSVREFLAAANKMNVVLRPPHSPDILQCHFILYPALSKALKGSRFTDVNMIQVKSGYALADFKVMHFAKCLER
ncbi:hypothetical protein Cfor_04041 [Coptotermes formosanus]|uniref:Tc1-like transposase DDE domain-containing protein n=1 Tax=Coptotermes formosanus TaxID=36987 RepID=A0A6L2PEF5_COPFO|nr:hypothetical protein Cfor_04041 [Coptotermes formosanus]